MNDNIKKIVEIFTNEAGKRLIGQENLVTNILIAFVAGGHVLLEGVPGLAKTLTVKTVAQMLYIQNTHVFLSLPVFRLLPSPADTV